MTDKPAFLSEEDVIAAVDRLDRARLTRFIRAEVIRPADAGGRMVYRQVDIARIELLCDLSEDFDFGDEALGMVMDLIDQLHGTRSDLRDLMLALAQEPEEVRQRIMTRLG